MTTRDYIKTATRFVQRLFRKRTKLTGRVINLWEHNGWGDSVYFYDWPSRQLIGWMRNKPVVGDEIRAKMESGKVARFVVCEVEYCRDPKDMFFAMVNDLKYLSGEPPCEPTAKHLTFLT